jgi:hypothetical protein
MYWESPMPIETFNRKVEWHRTWIRITRHNCVRTYMRSGMSKASWTRIHTLMVTGRKPSTLGGGMTKYFGYQGVHHEPTGS